MIPIFLHNDILWYSDIAIVHAQENMVLLYFCTSIMVFLELPIPQCIFFAVP